MFMSPTDGRFPWPGVSSKPSWCFRMLRTTGKQVAVERFCYTSWDMSSEAT